MARSRTTRVLAIAASLALAAPAAAVAGGGGGAAADPPIVGVPIERTQAALGNAADAIDAGDGAQAAGSLAAVRKYLIRSYRGARYLVANAPPPPPAGDGSANPRKFRRLARLSIRAAHRSAAGSHGWIRARASGDAPAGPAFADGPTAVFDVFNSQFTAATRAVGMLPDATGNLLDRVQTTINTAVVLRNRLVNFIHASAPPAPPPAGDGRVHAHASGAPVGGASFDAVMPGLIVLLDAEIQHMQATADDTSVPAASRAVLAKPIAADKQIATKVNQWWPPLPADD